MISPAVSASVAVRPVAPNWQPTNGSGDFPLLFSGLLNQVTDEGTPAPDLGNKKLSVPAKAGQLLGRPVHKLPAAATSNDPDPPVASLPAVTLTAPPPLPLVATEPDAASLSDLSLAAIQTDVFPQPAPTLAAAPVLSAESDGSPDLSTPRKLGSSRGDKQSLPLSAQPSKDEPPAPEAVPAQQTPDLLTALPQAAPSPGSFEKPAAIAPHSSAPSVAPKNAPSVSPSNAPSGASAELPAGELAFAARVAPAPASLPVPTHLASAVPAGAATAGEVTGPSRIEAATPVQSGIRDLSRQQNAESSEQDSHSNGEPGTSREQPAPSASARNKEPAAELRPEPAAKILSPETGPVPLSTSASTEAQPAIPAPKTEQPRAVAEPHPLPEPSISQPNQPVRDLSFRLSDPSGQEKLDVKVVASAGDVRVAVRSSDQDLTASLQQGLGDLTGRLESHGMQAETWRPAAGTTSPATQQMAHSGQQNLADDGSQGRRGQQQDPLTPVRRRNKPGWLQEIDSSFDTLHTDSIRKAQ